MAMKPLPVTLLTGFLGAGKTTLLNRLLSDATMADSLVIINEFGEIGLDHLFVETRDDGLVLMASGCLCCTIRGDLIATLEDLITTFDASETKPFRRIVIETTGLADPAPILQSLMGHPLILARYALDGVVTVVDAVNASSTLDQHHEAVKQIAVADRLVMTKTDLAPDITALLSRLRKINPAAPIYDAAKGEAVPHALIGGGPFDPESKAQAVSDWVKADLYHAAAPHHDHDVHHSEQGHSHSDSDSDSDSHAHSHAHSHDPNRHDDHIRAFCLTTEDPIAPHAFELFLSMLHALHGSRLLRVKGLVKLSDNPQRPVLLHAVQHVSHPPQRLTAWPDADQSTRLVFIVHDLASTEIERLWNAIRGQPGIDTADPAAMLDNPLSLRVS